MKLVAGMVDALSIHKWQLQIRGARDIAERNVEALLDTLLRMVRRKGSVTKVPAIERAEREADAVRSHVLILHFEHDTSTSLNVSCAQYPVQHRTLRDDETVAGYDKRSMRPGKMKFECAIRELGAFKLTTQEVQDLRLRSGDNTCRTRAAGYRVRRAGLKTQRHASHVVLRMGGRKGRRTMIAVSRAIGSIAVLVRMCRGLGTVERVRCGRTVMIARMRKDGRGEPVKREAIKPRRTEEWLAEPVQSRWRRTFRYVE